MPRCHRVDLDLAHVVHPARGPDHGAGEHVRVATQPLGRRRHDQVGAELDGPAEVGRSERVVDDQLGARAMGALGQGRDVGDDGGRVGDGLDVQQPGAGERRLHGGQIARIDVIGPDAEAREDPVEELARAAVDGARSDDAVTGPKRRRECGVDGRHARAEGEAGVGALELGDGRRHGRRCRVAEARVGVAVAGRRELGQLRRVVGGEGRTLIDGHGRARAAPSSGSAWRPGWRDWRSPGAADDAGRPWRASYAAKVIGPEAGSSSAVALGVDRLPTRIMLSPQEGAHRALECPVFGRLVQEALCAGGRSARGRASGSTLRSVRPSLPRGPGRLGRSGSATGPIGPAPRAQGVDRGVTQSGQRRVALGEHRRPCMRRARRALRSRRTPRHGGAASPTARNRGHDLWPRRPDAGDSRPPCLTLAGDACLRDLEDRSPGPGTWPSMLTRFRPARFAPYMT